MSITGPAVKLGIFLTVTSLITAALFFVVGDLRFGPTRSFTAAFSSASGSQPGDDVKVSGVVVGKVTAVRIVDHRTETGHLGAEIDIDVDTAVPVTTATTAAIKYKNLIGDRYIQLETDPAVQQTAREAGSTIPASQTRQALDMDALVNGFKPLLQGVDPDQANRLSASLVEVLNGRTQDIGELITEVGSLGQTIAQRDATIGSVVTDLNTVLGTIAERDTQFGALVDDMQVLVTGLAADRTTITDGLQGIEAGTRRIGDLVGRAKVDLSADIEALRGLAENLNRNTTTVNLLLTKLPETYRLLGRASGYGSFVNFFVCGLAIRYPTLDGGHRDTPMFTAPAARCK